MTINFTNNVFNFKEYELFLDTYIKENFSEPQSDEERRALEIKTGQLFTQFLENITIDHLPGSPEDIKISKLIKKILRYEPGRQLIERLIQANAKVSIKYTDSVDTPGYSHETKELKLPVNIDSYVITDCNGKRRFEKYKKFVNLAHELIHALHHAEKPNRTMQNQFATMYLVDPAFHTQEEQETVSGITSDRNGPSFSPISENILYRAAHLNMRINHEGLSLRHGTDKSTIPAIKAACMGAVDDVLPLLERDPTQMDKTYEFDRNYRYTGKFRLLCIAAMIQANDAVDYMIGKGADVHAKDGLGSPILAAVKGGNSYAIQQLLAAGVKPQAGCWWLLGLLSVFEGRLHNDIPEDILFPILDQIPLGDSILNETQYGNSPLSEACSNGFEKVIKKLIELEVDLNAIDPQSGNTPLMAVLARELQNKNDWEEAGPFRIDPKILHSIDLLMQTGKIRLDIANHNGQTAVSMAEKLGLEPISADSPCRQREETLQPTRRSMLPMLPPNFQFPPSFQFPPNFPFPRQNGPSSS